MQKYWKEKPICDWTIEIFNEKPFEFKSKLEQKKLNFTWKYSTGSWQVFYLFFYWFSIHDKRCYRQLKYTNSQKKKQSILFTDIPFGVCVCAPGMHQCANNNEAIDKRILSISFHASAESHKVDCGLCIELLWLWFH